MKIDHIEFGRLRAASWASVQCTIARCRTTNATRCLAKSATYFNAQSALPFIIRCSTVQSFFCLTLILLGVSPFAVSPCSSSCTSTLLFCASSPGSREISLLFASHCLRCSLHSPSVSLFMCDLWELSTRSLSLILSFNCEFLVRKQNSC